MEAPTTHLIPLESLKAVVTPLSQGECSNKTFRNILAIIENLSHLPNAKQVFVSQLSSISVQIAQQVSEDLKELQEQLQMPSESQKELLVQQLTIEKFTPRDSSQAKLLRTMKTIDYLFTSKKNKPSEQPALASSLFGQSRSQQVSTDRLDDFDSDLPLIPHQSQVMSGFNQGNFTEIWSRLQACLSHIQDDAQMAFVATVLLPLVECLMIMCKYTLSDKSSVKESALNTRKQEQGFFYLFTEKHRKVLNQLVRSNPKLLRGSFSLLIRNPKVLEFDSKRNYFNQQLHQKPQDFRNVVVYVNVRRSHIFQDSYYQLQNKSGKELRFGKLQIKFQEEEGADYGGVSREWYQELTREMFNPNYALFATSAEKTGVTYQPNQSSWVNPSHLLYFKFVGRIIGKAIYDNRLLDCYFTRSVYKHILRQPVDVSDMEAVDPEYHKSLVWMLNNSINDVLDLTFSAEQDEFGQTKVIDLIPDGRNIPVDDSNKSEYVKLIVENRLCTAIKDQIQSFLSGFHDIVPKELVSIFSEKELELLISGVPDIDIDDWKNNTEYRGYTSHSPQVQWFWRAVRGFDQEERAMLLQFITGTSKVPLEGFSHLQGIGGKQKFQIHKDFGKVDRLPSAHTCFNQLDLPVYESFEQLRDRLYKSITEATTGFGFE